MPLRLPVIIEEEFHPTLQLAGKFNKRTAVIIPHFGGLNGGYMRLKKADLFENPAVYVDTALAGRAEIEDFASDYGVDRILFGSDFPFGEPAYVKYKVENIFYGKDRKRSWPKICSAYWKKKFKIMDYLCGYTIKGDNLWD